MQWKIGVEAGTPVGRLSSRRKVMEDQVVALEVEGHGGIWDILGGRTESTRRWVGEVV